MSKRKHPIEPEGPSLTEEVKALAGPPPPGKVGQGDGEPVAVKVMASDEFLTMPDAEALKVAAAFRQVLDELQGIRRDVTDQVTKLSARMDAYDKDTARWKTDQKKFKQKLLDKADAVPARVREKAQAKAANDLAKMTGQARARVLTDRKQFAAQLRAEPRVAVTRPGRVEMGRDGSGPVTRIVPDVFHVKGLTFAFPPGKAVEVPRTVAQVIEQSDLSEQETSERAALLKSIPEDRVLVQKMREIDSKYNSPSMEVGQEELPV